MRKRIVGFVFSLLAVLVQGIYPASAQSPILISHSVLSTTENTDSVTMHYLLRVENVTNSTIAGLEISPIPTAKHIPAELSFLVGDLGAFGIVEMQVNIEAWTGCDCAEIAADPLPFSIRYLAGDGYLIDALVSVNEHGGQQ